MARIEGVVLPHDKRIEYALPYIYGIGLTRSRSILGTVGVNFDTRVKDLSDAQVASIQNEITKQRYRVEGALRKEVTLNIKRLQEIGSYRGERHKKGLPVHGQRTKTNARTKRGKVRGTVANKKKAPSKK
jgi:small subunit ribosomal protein S13